MLKNWPNSTIISASSENEVVAGNSLLNMPLIFGYTSVRLGMSGFELDLGHSLKAFSEVDFNACYGTSFAGGS